MLKRVSNRVLLYGKESGHMIKRLSQIINLGQFENFESHQEFEKNSILFGFNGAGKSTLSDLFYSMVEMEEMDSFWTDVGL